MSKKKVIDMDDPASSARVILGRLWDLSEEQLNRRNMAMHFVLSDLHTKLDELISEVLRKEK